MDKERARRIRLKENKHTVDMVLKNHSSGEMSSQESKIDIAMENIKKHLPEKQNNSLLKAINALKALKSLKELIDMYDEHDDEIPPKKQRKVYMKSEDIRSILLKDVAWSKTDNEDSFCPLTEEVFEQLLEKISSKVDQTMLVLPFISLRMQLAVTLRYLIVGESYRHLEAASHISRKYFAKIIPEMLQYLITILEKDFLKVPDTETEWTNVANDFDEFWEFPHTLGVVEARNFFVNFKNNTKSLIFLCVLDAHCRFQYIETIDCDEMEYTTAYVNSKFYRSLITNSLNIPSEVQLKGQTDKTPYFFVGGDIFGMDRYVLTNYDETLNLSRTQKAYNYRVRRARMPVQMAFEILFYRFQIFERFNYIKIDKVKLIIKTCCLLHNYLTQKLTIPLGHNEEEIEDLCTSVIPLPSQVREPYKNAFKARKNMENYCVNVGNIAEQWENIIKMEK